ncbi:SGNH/GDSL hydrolase family protein [Jeotgalibacillus campisalis]|uniref:Uncharacterized protein n=1 Tax=Jeotgalibacillus campisalis TaxID=220754 RepID=A0A0C2QYD3_9BACL|nr:hypothetical protein [Jeotgalibacillus campisalis]KIL43020.1 hypothetical protein KR50_34230 [Jeotgalibacillus campisalis]
MLKKVLLIVSIVLTGAVVYFGQDAWKDSQKEVHRSSSSVVESTSNANSEDSADSSTSIENESKKGSADELEDLIANQPQDVQEFWIESKESGDTVDITFVATESAVALEENWTTLIEESFLSSYEGIDFAFSLITHENEGTSEDWLTSLQSEAVTFEGQDIVLYELPVINDNGMLSSQDQIYYTNRFLEEMQSNFPETHLFTLPSQPLYNSTYYPGELETVQEVVEEQGIPFLNHWEDWPSIDDEELENYLTDDNDPNEEGNTIWGTYLVDYFSTN